MGGLEPAADGDVPAENMEKAAATVIELHRALVPSSRGFVGSLVSVLNTSMCFCVIVEQRLN